MRLHRRHAQEVKYLSAHAYSLSFFSGEALYHLCLIEDSFQPSLIFLINKILSYNSTNRKK